MQAQPSLLWRHCRARISSRLNVTRQEYSPYLCRGRVAFASVASLSCPPECVYHFEDVPAALLEVVLVREVAMVETLEVLVKVLVEVPNSYGLRIRPDAIVEMVESSELMVAESLFLSEMAWHAADPLTVEKKSDLWPRVVSFPQLKYELFPPNDLWVLQGLIFPPRALVGGFV